MFTGPRTRLRRKSRMKERGERLRRMIQERKEKVEELRLPAGA